VEVELILSLTDDGSSRYSDELEIDDSCSAPEEFIDVCIGTVVAEIE
jgi:hypothetical protein